jgi:methylmalonyl-CoA mutase C-terminal domain/subunit
MTGEKKVRLLLTKHPLDGHESGYNILTRGLRELGIEVIIGGSQMTNEIVDTAIQEDVDFIGYRIMAGDPLFLVQDLFERLKKKGADIPVVIGGIIRVKDIPKLKAMGVAEVYIPGSLLSEIANFMKNYKRARTA